MRTRTQQQFANLAQSAYEQNSPMDGGLMQDNDLDWGLQGPRFRLSGLTIALSLVWVVLVAAITLLVAGSSLGTASFWLGGGLVTLLVVALIPVGAVVLFLWLDFRLRDLGAQSDDVRDEIARFTEPTPANSGNVISIRHVVHKELSMLNEQLERSMTRTLSIEEKVRGAIDAMEKAFNDNERRLFSIVQELARQRESVSSATDQVRESVRGTREALQAELTALTEQIVEAGNYARGTVEEVNRGVIEAVADAAQGLAQNISAVVASDVEPLRHALDQRLLALRNVIASSGEGMVHALEEQRSQLGADMEVALGRIAGELERQATLADEIIAQATNSVEGSLDGALGQFENRIRESSQQFRSVLDAGGTTASEKLDAAWISINTAFGVRLDEMEVELEKRMTKLSDVAERAEAKLVPALEQSAERMERAIEVNGALRESTAELDLVLHERGEQLIKTVSMQFEGFHNAVGSRSEAISKALSEKLASTFARIDAHAEGLSGTLRDMEVSVDHSRERMSKAAVEHNMALMQTTEALSGVLGAANERFRTTIEEGGATLAETLDAARTASDNAIAFNIQVLREAGAQSGLEMTRVFSSALNQLETAVRREAEGVAGTGRQAAADLSGATEEMTRDLIAAADLIAETIRTRLDSGRREFEAASTSAFMPIDRTLTELLEGLTQRTSALETTLNDRAEGLERALKTGATTIDSVLGKGSEYIETTFDHSARALEENFAQQLRRLAAQSNVFNAERAKALDGEIETLGTVLDARTELLATFLKARSAEFADRMTESSRDFEERLAETLRQMSDGMVQGAAQMAEGAHREVDGLAARLKDLGAEMNALTDVQARALTEEFKAQRQALADALGAEEQNVRQLFAERTKGIEKAMAAGLVEVTGVMTKSGEQVSKSLKAAADTVRSGFEADAATIRTETGAGMTEVSVAISGIAKGLEQSLKDTLVGFDKRLEESTKAVIGKMTAEEKAATKRLEQATEAVTASTRRAAEVAAERVVALNGAVVQALSTLNSGPKKTSVDRPGPAKLAVDPEDAAAEKAGTDKAAAEKPSDKGSADKSAVKNAKA
jgi:hypothetical protein